MLKKIFLISIILIAVITSCSKKNIDINKSGKKESVIFPAPPDTGRIQFLTALSSSSNVAAKRSSFIRFILGESQADPIVKPYGVFLRNAKLYICDAGFKGLEIIDFEKKSFNYFVPKGKGQLKLPINCYVDEDNILYIADIERQQIVIFDKDGNYLNSIGGDENFKPSDVFVYNGKIWVTDSKNNRINVYNKSNDSLSFSFPPAEDQTEGHIYAPLNIYVYNDKVYVSDFGDFKIKIYSIDGKYISSVGSYGKNLGQFVRPKGVAVDHDENLFVVDAGFENTQIFNKSGKLLMFFGGPYKGPGYMWLPAKITIDYDNLKYFQQYVDKDFDLKYLIIVSNQYGPDKITIYGAIKPKKK